MIVINDSLNENIVRALCISGFRLFHELLFRMGKRFLNNLSVCDMFLSKGRCHRLYRVSQ